MAYVAFIRELRRRRVFRLAGIYLIGAWLLLQIADVTFEPIGLPPWAMTALVWAVIAAFPIALVLGWRYDIGDDGLIRITKAAKPEVAELALRRSDYVILASLLVVAVFSVYSLVTHLSQQQPDDSGAKSPLRADTIAVLPFVNLSPNTTDDYLSHGVSEEILNSLTQIPELKVIARASSFVFEDRQLTISEIAEQLGAQRLLDGSLRRDGDRVRITAQLVDAQSGVQLWSTDYDGQIADVFSFQQDIADHVVAALRDDLSIPISAAAGTGLSTANAAAFERYALGNSYYWQRGSGPETVEKALQNYGEAVALDPEFAEAWAALAAAYTSARSHGVRFEDEDPYELATAAANRAIALDESLGLAHLVLGTVYLIRTGDYANAGSYLQTAMQLSPREPTVLLWTTEAMLEVGMVADSLRFARLGYQLDPLSIARSLFLGRAFLNNRQYDAADRQFELAEELGAPAGQIWYFRWIVMIERRDFAAAKAWLDEIPFEENAHIATIRSAVETLLEPDGKRIRQTANAIAAAFNDADDPVVDGNTTAYLLATLGAIDSAYEVFDRQRELGHRINVNLWWRPGMRVIRSDARFVDLAEHVGLAAYWRNFGWPDICQPQGDSFVCR